MNMAQSANCGCFLKLRGCKVSNNMSKMKGEELENNVMVEILGTITQFLKVERWTKC